MPISLEPLLPHLPAWAMVLFRLTGIFVFAPVLGSVTIPGRVKVFLALTLSFCIYPILLTPGSHAAVFVEGTVASGLSLWSLGPAVGAELLIGLVIGYGASLPVIGMQLSGRVIDQQMGLGLAGVLNPEFNEQTGIISEFYFITALTVFLILDGHRVMLAALIGSFSSIPLGGFSPDGDVVLLIVGLLTSMFSLALRVATPLLCLVFLETIAMGFIAKTVPQMNILSIGFALRIMIGIGLIIGAIGLMIHVYAEAVQQTLESLTLFFHTPPG